MTPKLKPRPQEPTREEMIQFIRAGVEVYPATIGEVKDFIKKKYGDSPWIKHLLSEVSFDYKKDYSGNRFGMYDPDTNTILVPVYPFPWRSMGVGDSIFKNEPQLYHEYSDLIDLNTHNIDFSSGALQGKDDFSSASDKLIKTLYGIMQQRKAELSRPEKKKNVLEGIDHQLGHAILNNLRKEEQGSDPSNVFGMSYKDIERHVLSRMHSPTASAMFAIIAKRYVGDEIAANLEEWFFKEPEDPVKIHFDGPEVIAEMAKRDLTHVSVAGITSKTGDIHDISEEDWELFRRFLSEEDVDELKELKNIQEIDGRFGLMVYKRGEYFEISCSREEQNLMKEYNLSQEEYNRLFRVFNQHEIRKTLVVECFSILLDSLVDGNLKDDPGLENPKIGVKRDDLEFFSGFNFKGQPIFSDFIEEARKRMLTTPIKKAK